MRDNRASRRWRYWRGVYFGFDSHAGRVRVGGSGNSARKEVTTIMDTNFDCFSGRQLEELRRLVIDAVREKVEALRQDEWAVEKAGKAKDAPERIEAFWVAAAELLSSGLIGLYVHLAELMPVTLDEASSEASEQVPN